MINLLRTHPYFKEKNIVSCTLLENQGYCNENYLLVADEIKFIVRKLLRDDIDRDLEWTIQNLAFDKNITAEPLVFDRENGFMVFAFLEGEHKRNLDEVALKQVAKNLQKLHSINIDAKPIKLHITNKTDKVLKAFKVIDNHSEEYVLCHNDLNPLNIFFSNDVKFIDWEYAAVNDRYFDLACVCVEFGLNDEVQDLFLNVYFGNEDFILEKLKAYKVIYKTLCEEWFNSSV